MKTTSEPIAELEKAIARKIFNVLREQKPGDVAELRRLAADARQRGYSEIADHADGIATLFEEEDRGSL